MTAGFRRRDIVASADGTARKTRGVIQRILELDADTWADRSDCWHVGLGLGCMRGSQPCLRSRPTGPGTWAIVLWDGRAGPYAERAEDLVKVSPS